MPSGSPRFLIACHPTIGDVVGTTPLFSWIRGQYPDATIVALTSKLAGTLLAGNPAIDDVWSRPPKSPGELLRFIARGRAARFDTALITYGHNDSVRLANWLKIPTRITVGPIRSNIPVTQCLTIPQGVPLIPTTIEALASAIGVSPGDPKPTVQIPESAHATAERLCGTGPFIAYQLGASHPAKIWPAERFRAVWEALDLPAVIIGGPEEKTLSESAAQESSHPPLVLAGRTSLMETAAILERASLLITNDTGAMHIAGAVGTPTVSIFGPKLAVEHPPFGPRHALLQGVCRCIPHDLDSCDRTCLRSISVEAVIAAARDLLTDNS